MTNDCGQVRTRLWRGGVVELDDFPLADLSEHREDLQALLWVDLCRPGASLMAQLAEELGLDALAVEDAIGPGERPRASRRDGLFFVTVYDTTFIGPDGAARTDLDPQHSRLQRSRISIFVLPNGIVTIRPDDGVGMDVVLQRWAEQRELLAFGAGALLHGLLDVVVDGHQAAADRFDELVDEIEDELFADNSDNRAVQRKNYRMRKELMEFRRVVMPMREVLTAILRHRVEVGAPAELGPHFEDLNDNVVHVSEETESLREMTGSIFETNLALQDARLNTVMKKLTGWAAIIAVPTAVTGWFGQNVPYPGFSHHSGLIQSVVLIVVRSGALYGWLRSKDWI